MPIQPLLWRDRVLSGDFKFESFSRQIGCHCWLAGKSVLFVTQRGDLSWKRAVCLKEVKEEPQRLNSACA